MKHLQSAISNWNEEGPGRWKVTDNPCVDWVSLSYDIEGKFRPNVVAQDVPWQKWGGDALLRDAGVREYRIMTAVLSSGYSTWAKIEFGGTADCRGVGRRMGA